MKILKWSRSPKPTPPPPRAARLAWLSGRTDPIANPSWTGLVRYPCVASLLVGHEAKVWPISMVVEISGIMCLKKKTRIQFTVKKKKRCKPHHFYPFFNNIDHWTIFLNRNISQQNMVFYQRIASTAIPPGRHAKLVHEELVPQGGLINHILRRSTSAVPWLATVSTREVESCLTERIQRLSNHNRVFFKQKRVIYGYIYMNHIKQPNP